MLGGIPQQQPALMIVGGARQSWGSNVDWVWICCSTDPSPLQRTGLCLLGV